MKQVFVYSLAVVGLAAAAAAAGGILAATGAFSVGRSLQPPPVNLAIRESFDVPKADARSAAIVEAAERFVATLDEDQKATLVYDFTDNLQRARWSNFPDGPVQRGGLMMQGLSDAQRAALDALLGKVLSEQGVRNVVLQLAAEDTLDEERGGPNFGSAFYYVSFLGSPSTTDPWMFQFGGHHLAINATMFGPHMSFAPMLTGGEPLNLTFEGEDVHLTRTEIEAAQALLESLDETQKKAAVRGSRAINLLLGPGEDGAALAPEGVKGSDLGEQQRQLLLNLVATRLGFINEDDFAAKMEDVAAGLDETFFAWWGPQDAPGAAYFRVTGPSLVLEYAPQGDDPTDHAHNIYRDPQNDYGKAWIARP